MLRPLLILGFMIAALGGLNAVWADDQSRSEFSFPDGVYQPFSAWQQVQLGATSLLNPSVANNAAVVNSYSFDALKEAKVEGDVSAKLKSGSAVFAKLTADGNYVPLTSEETAELIDKLAAGQEVGEIALLSFQKIPPADSEKLIVWPLSQ